MKRQFGVIKILAIVLKVLGIITAAAAIIGGLVTLVMSFAGGDMWTAFGYDANSGFFVGLIAAFSVIILGALFAVFLYAYGEILMLMLSVENNTFKTVQLLEEVIKDETPE